MQVIPQAEEERARRLVDEVLSRKERRQLKYEGFVQVDGSEMSWRIYRDRRDGNGVIVESRGAYPQTDRFDAYTDREWLFDTFKQRGIYPAEYDEVGPADTFLSLYFMVKFEPRRADRIACG